MSLIKEFREFIAKGNVLDLAVAVVIGAAFSKIVTAVVEGVIMPLIGAVLPEGDWRSATITGLNIEVGRVLAATVDFLVIALVIFLVVKKLMARVMKADKPVETKPVAKECPECTEMIPLKAKRCKWCATVQPV